jgi:hypothetical protein
VLAIDSPPKPGLAGKSRQAEAALRKLGVGVCSTPADPASLQGPFYAWMRVGFVACERAARAGYPLYSGAGPVGGTAIEVDADRVKLPGLDHRNSPGESRVGVVSGSATRAALA